MKNKLTIRKQCSETNRLCDASEIGTSRKIEQLRHRALMLMERLPGLGIDADVYALSIIELRGLCAFLRRMVGGD